MWLAVIMWQLSISRTITWCCCHTIRQLLSVWTITWCCCHTIRQCVSHCECVNYHLVLLPHNQAVCVTLWVCELSLGVVATQSGSVCHIVSVWTITWCCCHTIRQYVSHCECVNYHLVLLPHNQAVCVTLWVCELSLGVVATQSGSCKCVNYHLVLLPHNQAVCVTLWVCELSLGVVATQSGSMCHIVSVWTITWCCCHTIRQCVSHCECVNYHLLLPHNQAVCVTLWVCELSLGVVATQSGSVCHIVSVCTSWVKVDPWKEGKKKQCYHLECPY